VTLSPLLDEIDFVVFDKDGTLIDFHAMWGAWALELGARLDGATRRPVSGDVFATIGLDPVGARVPRARRSPWRRWPRSGRSWPRSSGAGVPA
jgi:hypothetical protein